jgi:iron(III) transport system ATP-binding protein
LLDEPLSNLDAKLRLEMRTEIRRVCKEFKLTTVYVTHDQKEALSVSDRMAILESGRILQVGTPREVYKRPTRKTVAHFIGETDFIVGKVIGILKDSATVETAIGRFDGVLGDPTCPPVVGQDVTLSIRPECWELSHVQQTPQNSVRGTIGGFVYLGEVAQYDLLVRDRVLKVFERNPRFVDGASRGELFATVAPEDVVILVG